MAKLNYKAIYGHLVDLDKHWKCVFFGRMYIHVQIRSLLLSSPADFPVATVVVIQRPYLDLLAMHSFK